MYYDRELRHYGVKGMKWGRRRAPDQLSVNKSDMGATRTVKNDYNRMSNREFKSKYMTSKKTYAKRVAKSATGDPLADRKAKMSSKSYNRAVKADVDLRTAQQLNKRGERYGSTRSAGSQFVSTALTGSHGNRAYNNLRSSGMTKKGAAATVALLGDKAGMHVAYKKYKNSGTGKRYAGKVSKGYYN